MNDLVLCLVARCLQDLREEGAVQLGLRLSLFFFVCNCLLLFVIDCHCMSLFAIDCDCFNVRERKEAQCNWVRQGINLRRMTSELIASKKLTENDLAITWRMQFPNERTEGKGGGGYFDIQSVISRVIKGIFHDRLTLYCKCLLVYAP